MYVSYVMRVQVLAKLIDNRVFLAKAQAPLVSLLLRSVLTYMGDSLHTVPDLIKAIGLCCIAPVFLSSVE